MRSIVIASAAFCCCELESIGDEVSRGQIEFRLDFLAAVALDAFGREDAADLSGKQFFARLHLFGVLRIELELARRLGLGSHRCLHGGDLVGVLVYAGHLVTEVAEAGAGNQPDIAGSDDGDTHCVSSMGAGSPPLRTAPPPADRTVLL